MNIPPFIPDHTLLRPIGRGAYGEVWLARNVMGVLRAVKIVERRQFDSDRPYEREFAGIQRYEPVSRLADGLVHVLHVGRNDGAKYFYYVMELADDANVEDKLRSDDPADANLKIAAYSQRTLRSDIKQLRRVPIADCLRVALDVVSGLVKLHEQGLVHRDVKPGNIIFVDARAKLADIGLVSKGGEGRTFVGTEGYIPPEGPGSPAADLYALGMCLYEAATGYPPERFPQVPREWFAEDAGDEAIEFHEIVIKACEGAKERRYQSADQMQADLALLQSGQSVRRVRRLEKRAAVAQRFAWAAGIIVTGAVLAAFGASWKARLAERTQKRESALLQEAREARAQESEARSRAESAELDARRQLNAALFEQARALVQSREIGHRTRALAALQQARGATNLAEMRRVAFAALALPDLQPENQLDLDSSLTLVQPDPDFRRIAFAQGVGPVTLCSLPDLQLLATLPASTNRDAYYGVWSKDGRFLAVKRQHDGAGIRADWEVWDLIKTQRVFTPGPDVAHNSVMFHPRESRLMTGHGGGRVTEWNAENGQEVRTFKFPNTPHALAYSPDGERVVACFRRGTNWLISFYKEGTWELLREVDYPEPIEFVAWHPDGRWVTGTAPNASEWARGVHLIESDTGVITTLGEHKIKTAASEFVANGDYLFSGGWDREIKCWDLRTRHREFTYPGPGYLHFWNASGQRCAIILPNQTVQFHSFAPPRYQALSGNPGELIHSGQFSPDGRWFAARDGRQLCVWDLKTKSPSMAVPVALKTTFFFSPDSSELFAIPDEYGQRGYFDHWRVMPGTTSGSPRIVQQALVELPSGITHAAAVSNELVMTSAQGVRFLALTNLASAERRDVSIPAGIGYVSPDGRWLAMQYHYSPFVGVYHLPEVREVARLQTSNLVGFITFSPNGDEMLVLNRSGAEWFETASWNRTRHEPGAGVSGSYAFYTPDGNGIWMVNHFRKAALHDRRTLQPILPLPSEVLPLAVSPDGHQLAVSVEGRRIQLWDLQQLRAELNTLGLDW